MRLCFILATLLFTATSNAELLCAISGESPKEANIFDQPIYQGDISASHMVAIKSDHGVISGEAITEELIKVMTAKATQKLGGEAPKINAEFEGALLVVGDLQDDGMLSVGLGHFDLAKSDDIIVSDFTVNGSLERPLIFMDLQHRISVVCQQKDKSEPAK